MRLELTNDEVCMAINALDFYSRIWIGQYDEINSLLRLYGQNKLENLNFDDYKEEYLRLRCILIPELANESFNCILGILEGDLPQIRCECQRDTVYKQCGGIATCKAY